jgi:hypothetical protein
MDLEREAKLTRMSQDLAQMADEHYDRTGRLSVDDMELLRQHMRDYLAHEMPVPVDYGALHRDSQQVPEKFRQS